MILLPELEINQQEELDFILSHLSEPLFPRTVSTADTNNAQILTYNKHDALALFKRSNFIDCRINAFPSPCALPHSDTITRFLGIINKIPPSIIMIDLDRKDFSSEKGHQLSLIRTIKKIHQKFGSDVKPTVVWSGKGYHVIQPIKAVILENLKEFSSIKQASVRFLRFAEWYLSKGKSDQAHNAKCRLDSY
jgi:hypothetical protein